MRCLRLARVRVFVLAIVVLVALAVLLLATEWMSGWSGPWFGRGGDLKRRPYRTLVGPVDARRGITGVMELGMSRSSLSRSLGKPLVPGISSDEARKRGLFDPEDVANEFYDGVFAWVSYGAQAQVISIKFDLHGYTWKFGGHQVVALATENGTYLLSDTLTQAETVRMLKLRGERVRVQTVDVYIEGTGTDLHFDEVGGRLQSVFIVPGVTPGGTPAHAKGKH